ncbi:hypothetical protein GO608_011605 [Aromatoleum buckelii]|nr:hypothetical protein [Aromatoleum buckelii]
MDTTPKYNNVLTYKNRSDSLVCRRDRPPEDEPKERDLRAKQSETGAAANAALPFNESNSKLVRR